MASETMLSDRVSRMETCLQKELGFGTSSNGRLGSWQQRYAAKLEQLDSQIHGGEGLGLKTRVLILWHSYVWVIGVAGAVIGAVLAKVLGL